MKVKVLLNIGKNATDFPPLTEGEHEVTREIGLKLIERGWAKAVTEPSAQIKAVPGESTIEATPEKAAADVKTFRDKTSR